MATVKFGAFVTGLKGKIGGSVFQSGKIGYVVKNKQSWQNNKYKPALTFDAGDPLPTAKSIISRASRLWRTLTDAQRLAWNTAAVNFPFKNKYGEAYTGSGYQVFMQLNSNLFSIGYTAISIPPIVTAPEPAFYPFPGGLIGGYYWEWGEWIQANELGMVVSMAGPFAKGHEPSASDYSRIFCGLVPADDEINLYPYAQAIKGSFGSGGMVFFKWELIDTVTGVNVLTTYTRGTNEYEPPIEP